ncbi:MAG: hypothetical protein RLZZ387_5325 [Chloroflexota bacterium]|jgi:DNA-binding PadR family transcriptional regulator
MKQPFTVELALLGFVRHQPMHPYEIHQRLHQTETLSAVWHLKQAHLYAILRRLEDEGYLTSVTEPQGSRPPRKVLSMTPQGRAAFNAWLNEPVAHGRDFRLEFLAKLFFAQQEGPVAVGTLVKHQCHACQQRLDALDQQLAALAPEQQYERLVLEFRRGQLAAIIAWLERCLDVLAPASRGICHG